MDQNSSRWGIFHGSTKLKSIFQEQKRKTHETPLRKTCVTSLLRYCSVLKTFSTTITEPLILPLQINLSSGLSRCSSTVDRCCIVKCLKTKI